MGAAAYNRGSRVIRRQAEALGIAPAGEHKPRPRPESWGDRAKARALERARRILRGCRRYGRETSEEILAGAVQMVARVSLETATVAARRALDEEATTHSVSADATG